jgi:hypothetical protein
MRPAAPPRRSAARALSVAACAALAFVLAARAVTGASRERRFFSARQGVGVEAPAAWTLSLHTGYPEILCVLLHPDGSRISLSAAPTRATSARALAEESRKGLEAEHLVIEKIGEGPRGGALVEAHGAGKDAAVRQLYLVRPAGAGKLQGVVLTLATRAATLASAQAGFDWVVAHLALETPADAEEEAAAAARKRSGPIDAGAR